MARIWAITSGNWSTNATWSGSTVPTILDEVYLNGYDVILNSNPVCAVITNELCPDTNQQGGHLVINTSGTRTINADLRGVNSDHLILDSTNRAAVTLNVVGDVVTSNCNFIYYSVNTTGTWQRKEINITGDVSNDSIFATASYQEYIHKFQITGGNVVLNKIFTASQNSSAKVQLLDVINGNLTINTTNSNVLTIRVTGNCRLNDSISSVTNIRVDGNLTIYGNLSATAATINGNIIAMSNHIVAATTLNVGGNIEYQSNNNTVGVLYTTLNILNPDTFTWHDISTPRVNPFMIITDADTRNLLQYPAEDRVVLGTPYAFGEKVGTFDVDYPPETVVLYEYVYDNGNKEGTLQIPTSPSTSDIVTAIKNDSDLGGKINTTNTNVGIISTAVITIDGKVDIIDTNVDTLLSRLTSVLTQRLGQSVTVEILQQILVAHLDN